MEISLVHRDFTASSSLDGQRYFIRGSIDPQHSTHGRCERYSEDDPVCKLRVYTSSAISSGRMAASKWPLFEPPCASYPLKSYGGERETRSVIFDQWMSNLFVCHQVAFSSLWCVRTKASRSDIFCWLASAAHSATRLRRDYTSPPFQGEARNLVYCSSYRTN